LLRENGLFSEWIMPLTCWEQRKQGDRRIDMKYERLRFSECAECGAVVLAGMVGGLPVKINTRTLPARHAKVLCYYRVLVFLIERRSTGNVWADFWDPATHDLDRPDRWLAIAHTCGARRGQV
jgi:hypothetical protein